MVATFFGVIFNFVGIVLLFRYGLPEIALPGQAAPRSAASESIDEMNHRRSGEIGLVLLLLGTLLQAIGAFAG